MARLLSFLAGAAALVALPWVLPDYQLSLAVQVLVFALLGMSVDLLAGYAGRTSLGHGAIFGTATYVSLYCSATLHLSPWIGLLLGIAAAVLLALVFAALAVRTSGVYFLLLTLALGMVVWGVCLRWSSVTGGENGLRGGARPALIASGPALYWLVLAATIATAAGAWRLVRSPFGLALRGIRDSGLRMQSLGYGTTALLIAGFAVSGLIAGIGGGLYGMFNEFASPSTVALSTSVAGLLIAIIGGVGTLFGSFVGAVVLVILQNVVSDYTDRWQSVMGLMFIGLMIFAPTGLIGQWRRLRPRAAARKPLS